MNNSTASIKERTKHNTKVLAVWTAAWVLSMAFATFGPKFLWHEVEYLSLLAITLNIGIGVGMIWANKVHLQGLDELDQKIQLQAMAVTLGTGLVLGLAYSNLAIAGLIEHADISFLVIIMGLTHLVAIIFGRKKYQ